MRARRDRRSKGGDAPKTGRPPGGPQRVAKADTGPGAPGWPGWKLDLATASYWSPKVTAAAQQALSREQLDAIAAAYAADHPGQDGKATGKRERNDAALAWLLLWLAGRDWVKENFADVAAGITADSVLIGGASAEAAVNGDEDADTGDWAPGDAKAAAAVAGVLGLGGLLASAGGGKGDLPDIAEDMGDGYLNVVSRVLAGWDPDTAADELGDMLADAVADGAYAEALTVTQITVVGGQAALAYYLANGTTDVYWQTTPGACPLCLANEAASPIRAGTAFPSGDIAPPGHPHCRCGLLPAWLTSQDNSDQ